MTLADASWRPVDVPSSSEVEAVYDYTDAAGVTLFQVVRFRPKMFRTRRLLQDGSVLWGAGGLKPVLYRLPDIQRAHTVLLLEGEKDVGTAERLGLPPGWAASNNPHGPIMWRPDYALALAGKTVVICPDTDEHGQLLPGRVAASMRGGPPISVIRLPYGCKDLTEWHEAGGSASAFADLLAGAETLVYPRPDAVRQRVTGGIDHALDRLTRLRGIHGETAHPILDPETVGETFPDWYGTTVDGQAFVAVTGFEATLTSAVRELKDDIGRDAARLDRIEHAVMQSKL